MRLSRISHIKVIRLGRIFRRQSINLLDNRQYPEAFAQLTNHEHCLVHVMQFVLQLDGTRNLEIRKAVDLGLAQDIFVKRVDVALFQPFVSVDDMLQFVKEPSIYLGQFMNLVYSIATVHGL